MFSFNRSLALASIIYLPWLGCSSSQTSTHILNTATRHELDQLQIVELGRRIFEDRSLSEPQGLSCSSCHGQAKAFTGNNDSPIAAVARGALPDTFGSRNSPTAMYASFSPEFHVLSEVDDQGLDVFVPTGGQFWDGRAKNLEEQAKGPFLNTREMNNPSKESVVKKIEHGSYATLFTNVFGATAFADPDTAYNQIATAITAFEKSAPFNPFNSKFDAVLRAEEEFSTAEAKGFALFKDPEKGNCIACHAGNPASSDSKDWLFTDFTFDTLGVPRNTAIPDNQKESFFDLGLCQQSQLSTFAPHEFDKSSVCGAFKVPTLRNVAVTAPYMHNGYFTNLRDTVKFYVTRDTNPEFWYSKDQSGLVLKYNDLPLMYQKNVNVDEVPYDRKLGETPRLNDEEIDAIVAFLQTLTDR